MAGCIMSTPSESAQNLLLALGVALLLASAFALIDGRLPPADCLEGETACVSSSELGWLIPGTAFICLTLGLSAKIARRAGKKTILDRFFSHESESDLNKRMSEDFSDAHDTDRLSGAWANMEVKMLESTHGEEE